MDRKELKNFLYDIYGISKMVTLFNNQTEEIEY